MANLRTVFFIGVVGGLVGYACGAVFTPARAVAQQFGSEDAGLPTTTPATDAGGPAPTTNPVGTLPQPACRQWELKAEPQGVYNTGPVVLVEEGWEPFAFSSSHVVVLLRRCVR